MPQQYKRAQCVAGPSKTHMPEDATDKVIQTQNLIGGGGESIMGREATTYSRAVRWFVGCMKLATLIGGMQGWRGSWRLFPYEAL